MVEQLVMYAARSSIKSFAKLKALRYRELGSLYPHLLHTMLTPRARMLCGG